MAKILYGGTKYLFFKLVNREDARCKLEALQVHHPETYAHSLRVGLLSIDLGYGNFTQENDLKNLGLAGLLHDIGKIRIPLNILNSKGKLNEEEQGILAEHPRLGFLELKEPEYDLIRKIVIAHHEYKLNPYPRDMNSEINGECRRVYDPLVSKCSQIIAAADMFDALANVRAYKEKFDLPQIEEIFKEQFKGDQKYVQQILCRY